VGVVGTVESREVLNEAILKQEVPLIVVGKEVLNEAVVSKPRSLNFEVRATRSLWLKQYKEAQEAVEQERVLRGQSHSPTWTSRIQGLVDLGLGNLVKAEEHLYSALSDARANSDMLEEIPILIGLAELERQQGKFSTAHEYLGDIWELAERNAVRLYLADAFNILAQINRDEGLLDEAVEAAGRAYHLAWCDGPPFAYHWGLQIAKGHLTALSAPEPDLPPFDQSRYKDGSEVMDQDIPPVNAAELW
jgi:tetratricopeptide (TPR) repeat protein